MLAPYYSLDSDELSFSAIRAQGKGGQNVNKVSSAVQLRFSIPASSLPQRVKQRMLENRDFRINADGDLVIKAQRFRSQLQNKEDALTRLNQLIAEASKFQKKRIATRPSLSSKRRRLEQKGRRSDVKKNRSKPLF